jgi:hypothetical protein
MSLVQYVEHVADRASDAIECLHQDLAVDAARIMNNGSAKRRLIRRSDVQILEPTRNCPVLTYSQSGTFLITEPEFLSFNEFIELVNLCQTQLHISSKCRKTC